MRKMTQQKYPFNFFKTPINDNEHGIKNDTLITTSSNLLSRHLSHKVNLYHYKNRINNFFIKKPINSIITLGDSLSDRGEMAHRYLFAKMPLASIAGPKSKSPRGRFCNGYVWDDHFGAILASNALINTLKNKKNQATDISDEIIHERAVFKLNRQNYHLNDYQFISYKWHHLLRNYNQGGLTAHDYKKSFSIHLRRQLARLIVATLSEQRNKLLADDITSGITQEQKNNTLIIEWSGANDLITVNNIADKTIFDTVKRAIDARMKNITCLMKAGYKNFLLFNLPDLSLTPRFQNSDKKLQERAHAVSEYFNKLLTIKIRKLLYAQKRINIDIFDVNTVFTSLYQDIKSTKFRKYYAVDNSKIKSTYVKSVDFKIDKIKKVSPANGYLFWDSVHPTALVHSVLAEKFYEKFSHKYSFSLRRIDLEKKPAKILYHYLQDQYLKYLKKNSLPQSDFFNKKFKSSPHSEKSCKLKLLDIINNIQQNNSFYKEYRAVMEQLGWLCNGEISGDIKRVLFPQLMSVKGKLFNEMP